MFYSNPRLPQVESGRTEEAPFKLVLPVLAFLSGRASASSMGRSKAFTDLLASGQLTARSSFVVPQWDGDFQQASSTFLKFTGVMLNMFCNFT